MTPVRHLLLDADDVLQVGGAGFRPLLAEAFGEDASGWLTETFRHDGDVLCGRAPVLPLLERRLHELGRDVDARSLYGLLWLEIEVHRPVLDLVARLRRAGLTVHLATNQDPDRATHMKRALGYDATLDGSYYSSDLGIAKPSARFFETILADLGAEASSVAFVDDLATNVAGARAVGLHAVQWEIDDGMAVLESRLAALGVSAGDRTSTP